MKINETRRVQGISAYRNHEIKTNASSRAPGRRDEVQISQEAKELLQTGSSERVRLEKLDQLREKINAGTYKVDDQDLAAKILPYLLD